MRLNTRLPCSHMLHTRRCFSSTRTLSALVQEGHSGKMPHQIPAAAAVQAIMRRAYQTAELVSSADDRVKAAAAVAAQDDPFGGQEVEAAVRAVQAAAAAEVPATEPESETSALAAPSAAEAAPAAADASGALVSERQAGSASAQPSVHTPEAAAAAGSVSDWESIPSGDISQEHIKQLLSVLPTSRQTTEEAAAAGKQQQSTKWVQRAKYLATLLDDAAAGKAVLAGKTDAQNKLLRAEVVQLRPALETAAQLAWDNSTWEVRPFAAIEMKRVSCKGLLAGPCVATLSVALPV